jgi:hypothetical protein
MIERNDSGKMTSAEKHTYAPWLLAVGTGLAGFTFGVTAREQDQYASPSEPPPVAKAVEFPENFAPGIASIHVHKRDLKDPERIVQEFEQTHPNLDVVAYEPQAKKLLHSGTMHQLKVVYRLKAEE